MFLALTLSLLHAATGATANRIPLEIHKDFASVLTAKVDGVNVRLQFDLGSSNALMLQKGVIDSIKAVPTGESVKLQGVDGFFEAPTYKVARVQLGTQVFTDVVALLDVPRKGYQPGDFAQGFLGTGLLKPYQLVLDYPERAMTLVDRPSPGTCEGTNVPFLKGWRGEPVTKAELDRGPATLWWDTGAPMSVLSSKFAGSDASPLKTTRLTLGGTDFGPWPFDVWNISLPGFDGFIGHDFFAKHVVCIDFPQNRVVIGPLTAPAPARQ
jgi:hypothetical protein